MFVKGLMTLGTVWMTAHYGYTVALTDTRMILGFPSSSLLSRKSVLVYTLRGSWIPSSTSSTDAMLSVSVLSSSSLPAGMAELTEWLLNSENSTRENTTEYTEIMIYFCRCAVLNLKVTLGRLISPHLSVTVNSLVASFL